MKILQIIAHVALATLSASSFTQGRQVIIDLEKGDLKKPDLFRDGGYSIVVRGRNTLRYKILITRGDDTNVFRSPLGAFKPEEVKGKGGAGAGPGDPTLAKGIGENAAPVIQKLVARSREAVEAMSHADNSAQALAAANEYLAFLTTFLAKDQGKQAKPFEHESAITKLLDNVKAYLATPVEDATDIEETANRAFAQSVMDQKDQIVQDARQTVSALTKALSSSLFDTVAGPFQTTGDQVNFSLKVEDSYKIEPDLGPIPYKFGVDNGFKIDFSAGILFTTLHDMTYQTTKLPDDTFQVSEGQSPNGRILTGAFVHFRGFPFKTNQVSLSLGILPEDKPVYAVGFSWHESSLTQRLVLTFGIALGQVSRYDGSGNGIIPSTTVPTINRYMTRPFISLSYNF